MKTKIFSILFVLICLMGGSKQADAYCWPTSCTNCYFDHWDQFHQAVCNCLDWHLDVNCNLSETFVVWSISVGGQCSDINVGSGSGGTGACPPFGSGGGGAGTGCMK